jgi:hypothetical protein
VIIVNKMDNNLDIFRSVWTQLGVNEEFKYCVQIIINKLLNSDSVNGISISINILFL